MGITRPTGEQLRFRSATTGDHILDTYMENSEKGSRTLPDLMDDLFDSSGVFRAANFEFRFDSTNDKIQFRAGNFANSNTGWTDITTFFDITGTFSASTTYNNFDLLTLTNKDVYIVHGLSSGTTFADEAAVIASANTEKLVDVSEARDWASKTDGQVVSTDYSSKAYAVGGTGVDTTTGSAKDWAIKTSSTVGNTSEYSAKYWATSTAVTTVSSGIANINTVAAAIANVNTTATNISNVNTVAGISADVTSVANIDSNVTTVAGISANTTTVAGIASNVTTVAGISANVTTVAGIASNVTTVANNNTDVSTVATNVTDLQTVADEIDNNNLQTVANDIAAVITAADDLNEATSEIDTVANSIANVDLVGGSIANVNTVATNIANVNTTATNIANVNTVGGISANVTTVAGISANVTTAATNNANITTVAGISGNVTTVAGISANVTTVAGISADVTTAATNVTAFNNTYLGAQSSAPTQDPDGSALDLGDLYFDTTSNTMKVYAQSGWTAAGSSVNGTADRFNYTATAGQTTFTGADANGNSLAYDSGYADIYMNGVKLAPADYTATSGTSIVLASGAALNDTLEIIAYGTFTLSTHYTKTQSDARYVNVAGDTVTGNLSFGDSDKAIFGAGSDLQISHDGNNSLIAEVGTGNLHITAQDLRLQSANNQDAIKCIQNGAVTLYYDNAAKLATTSTGIQVTGNIANASGDLTLDVAGDIILDADGGDIFIKDGGTERARIITGNAGFLDIYSPVSDQDVRIRGIDGSSIVNALTLDMSDAGAATFSGAVNIPGFIKHVGDDNSFFGFPGGDEFRLELGGVERISMNGSGTTFNEDGADRDFRVESSAYTHAMYVDSGAHRILLGNSDHQLASTGHVFGLDGYSYQTRNGDLMWLNCLASSGSAITFMQNTVTKGSVTVNSTGVTYNTTSDRRLKKDIETITDGTDKLMAMNPVTHGWKADPEADTVHGFIAQEMLDIVPEAVSGDPEGEDMMSMDYGRITPVLVAALQDAHKKIEALEERLAELEVK